MAKMINQLGDIGDLPFTVDGKPQIGTMSDAPPTDFTTANRPQQPVQLPSQRIDSSVGDAGAGGGADVAKVDTPSVSQAGAGSIGSTQSVFKNLK